MIELKFGNVLRWETHSCIFPFRRQTYNIQTVI